MKKYKYQIIQESINEEIYQKNYKNGDILPTERDLAKKFNVSQLTVNKALDELAKTGLIEKIQGSGSYVRKLKIEEKVITMSSFTEEQKRAGNTIKTKILKYSLKKCKDFSIPNLDNKLQIKKTDYVHYIKRLRYVNDSPALLQDVYVSAIQIPDIDIDELKGSFYSYVENKLKLELGNGYSHLEAVLPNDEIEKYLECDKKTPVFYLWHISYLKNGKPFEYVDTWQNYRTYSMEFTNKRQ